VATLVSRHVPEVARCHGPTARRPARRSAASHRRRRIRRLLCEREQLIKDARDERESWQAIASALGVSRQAAWQAHREGAVVVAQIRSRSDLTDEAAMAVARSALRDVRRETTG